MWAPFCEEIELSTGANNEVKEEKDNRTSCDKEKS